MCLSGAPQCIMLLPGSMFCIHSYHDATTITTTNHYRELTHEHPPPLSRGSAGPLAKAHLAFVPSQTTTVDGTHQTQRQQPRQQSQKQDHHQKHG